MATTICASSTISLYSTPTKPTTTRTLHPPPHLPPSSSSSSSSQRLDLSIVFDESFTTISLANAAVQAARDAVSFALALKEMSFHQDDEFQGRLVVSGVQRRKRRKRRKGSNLETSKKDCMEISISFRSSSRSAFLTPKEEAEFTLYVKEGARLEAAWRNLWETKECEPTSSQWAKTIGMKRSSLDRTLCKSRESRERIILSYRRLVVSIANSYQHKGLSLEDLIQEGSIGLLRGAERFDPKKGYKLSTYVYWWIKQAIIKAVARKSRIIRLSGSMSEMVPKIAEATTVLTRRLGRQPTVDELATMTGIRVPSVRLLLKRSKPPLSLDQSPTDDGCMTLQDIIAGPEELRPEIMVQNQIMKQEVEKLLNTLGEREAIILRLYFGLTGEIPRSFDEIGRLMNLSRERVRQIHCIAFTKLKHIKTIDNLVYMM